MGLRWLVRQGAAGVFCRAYPPEPRDVSLVQLIANPGDFHGGLVRVIGFCRLEFEGNALYLHRELGPTRRLAPRR